MWKCASVALLLALCSAGAFAESPLVEVDMDTDVCAMTDVLVAMKKLLVLLSKEIRDLREQVKNSCHSSETTCTNATTTATTASPSTVVEAVETLAPGSSTPASTSTDDPDDIDIFLEVDEEEDEEFDYVDPEENPVSEVISGVKDWWGTFSLFPSKTTTDATIASQPDDDDHEEEEDVEDTTTMAPKQQPNTTTTSTTTTTTTTTTTPLPYAIPPAPTWCPTPFSLIADGCFLVVHNRRDWRTWGDAYAFCQGYDGELSSPWRLSQLQDYLTRHYSDAFWVGARHVPARRSWEWLTGRKVDQGEWKPGQPNRHPGKKCVFLDKWSGYHANNYFCGEKYPFICESRV